MKKYLIAVAIFGFATIAKSQHSVVLKTGEKIEGVVMELMDDELTIYVQREPNKIALRDISTTFFD